MSKLFNWAAARIVAAFALALPLAAMATTSTYSTYKDDTDTPGAGGAFTTGQAFQLNATWMFNTSGDDLASSSAAVKVESIAVKWASSTHGNADIGHNKGGEQPDAYLVVTTPQDVIVGVSGVNDAKWVANGTSTFAFTDLVLASNAQYIYYFATDVSGLAVGQVLAAGKKKNGRVLGAWHGSTHANDTVVHIINSNQYSINSIFTVSAAQTTSLTTSSEAVALNAGSASVFVTGAVANGVVNVASGATVPALTVVGQATTLKLADSLSATYLYLPATTTIDASDVTFAMPSGDATTAETVLVLGKISSASNPTVTLPALAEGYAFEPVVYDDTGIKVTVSKPVDATVTLVNGTELLWSNVKPAGWINSAVPTITIDNTSNAGTLVFDENVQAAKIVLPGGWAANIKRSAGVTVDIPYFSCPNNYANHTFTDFEAIPQTVQTTTSADKIYVSGTETLTSFPQISTANQCADISIAQKATFADNGFNVVGSKTINIDMGANISAARFVLGNNGGVTQTVNQNGGTVTVTGSAAPTSNQASILLGHWGSGATATLKTLGGTFTANNVASRLGWDGTATWQIGGGTSAAQVNVYGIVNGGNGHSGAGTLNIMANGTLNLGAGGIDFNNSSNGGNINLAGGTIDTGASAVTITNAKDGGTIINQGTTTAINVGSGETLTVNAVLSGSGVGTLNKTGEGKMILAKTATTRGKLLVTAGTVEFNEGISWGSNGTVEIGQNGTLNVLTTESVAEGELLVAGAFTVSGTVLNNGTAVDVDVKPTGIYIAMSSVTITVPAVANTMVNVVSSEGDVVDNGDGTYTVNEGATVTITYAANDGYELSGTSVYTIESAEDGSTITITDTTTAAYVATFNGTSYTSLSAAVSAWAEAEAAAAFMNPVVLTADVTEDVTIPVNVNASVVPLQMQGSATINGTITISAGATFKPLATVLFGGDVVVNGTLVRAGASTLSIGGDLTLAEGATLGATTLDAVDPVYAVAGAVEVEGVLNISLSSSTLEAGSYKVVTGTSVTRDEEADVVVFLNDVENDNWVLSSTPTELTITGAAATVDGEKFATFAEAVAAANGVETITLLASASWTLTVGETLIVEAGAFTMTVTPPAGYALVETAVSEGVVAYTTQQYVAKLRNPRVGTNTYEDEVYYTSLKAALADVVEQTQAVYADYKATVTLLADDRVSFADVTVAESIPSNGSIVIDKTVVINGAGFKVYGNTNAEILNATSYVEPGTEDKDMLADLADGSNLLGFFVKRGNVTFTNITLTEFGDTAYLNKFGYTPIQTASAYTGTLTLNGVNFSKFNRTAVCVRGGTLSMTGGNISGGTVNKEGDSGNERYFQQPIEVRGGTATISGVTITGGNDIAGNGGGAIVAWSATTVTNVIVNFTGVGIWADYPVITVTGDSTSVTATDKALFVEDGGTINVSAGTFTGALAIDAVPGSSISITGGTFSVDPSDYVASGYAANKSGDVWVVSEYVPPSGIDPESGTEIAVDTTKTPEEQAADAQAAAAAMDVKKTADASSVDQTTWNGYFTKTAEKVNDVWVAKAELNPAVVLPVDGAEETPLTDMLESVTAAAVDTTGETTASVPTKAGLYYWIAGATEVNAASYTPGTAVLGNGETKPLARPTLTGENGKAFFKVCVDIVAPTKE